jgi:FMN phosphatase YigB (HAD superfamily)
MSLRDEQRAVVFDIGWVLLHLAPGPVLTWLRDQGCALQGLDELGARVGIEDHESGRLDGTGLLANLAALAGGADLEHARRHWLDLFDYQADMFELARRLRRRYRVYLLSNVGELHWAHLNDRYRMGELADDALPSFEAGVMKPHAAIYEQAERRFGLVPAQTVFIDDRSDNIEAVRRRGWRGIVHRTATATIEELERLGYSTR